MITIANANGPTGGSDPNTSGSTALSTMTHNIGRKDSSKVQSVQNYVQARDLDQHHQRSQQEQKNLGTAPI